MRYGDADWSKQCSSGAQRPFSCLRWFSAPPACACVVGFSKQTNAWATSSVDLHGLLLARSHHAGDQRRTIVPCRSWLFVSFPLSAESRIKDQGRFAIGSWPPISKLREEAPSPKYFCLASPTFSHRRPYDFFLLVFF